MAAAGVLSLDALLAREPLGLLAGRAALYVDDLAVPEREHLEALLARARVVDPLGRADDDVVADSGELGLDVDSSAAAFVDLEGQDLTGLVGAVSGGCAFPPEVAVRDAAPLAFVGDQFGEWAAIASVERIRRCSELVDHTVRDHATGRWR